MAQPYSVAAAQRLKATSSAISTPSTSCSTWAVRTRPTHGTVKFLVELDGENIVNIDIQVGYLHRGSRRSASGNLVPGDPVHRPLNYNSAVLANVAFCMAWRSCRDRDAGALQWLCA